MLILHHYPVSPFSEKVRAILGYTGLAWGSAHVAEMPPRPSIDALAGGYRRIPVAQIGADVFCDTRTITEEIARLSDRPELALSGVSDEVREFVKTADLEIFFASVMSTNVLTLLKRVRRDTSTLHTLKLALDRVRFGSTIKVQGIRGDEGKARLATHLADMESRLSDTPFLFGDSPNIGDFAAYHALWFKRDLGKSGYIRTFTNVNAWLDRMVALGHGTPEALTTEQALRAAREAKPRPLPETRNDDSGSALVGSVVRIAPTDYGPEPVRGTLVASTETRHIIAREHAQVGRVHVHFPRERFALSRA